MLAGAWCEDGDVPLLGRGECFVAWARPVMPPSRLLDDEILQRVSRLRTEIDKARHAMGVVIGRSLVTACARTPVRVRFRDGQRPAVEGCDIHLSVSHGGEWVVAAATRAGEVGVDVEEIASLADADNIASIVLSERERACYDGLEHAAARQAWLARAWTCKEAVLKATGEGLAVAPRALSLDLTVASTLVSSDAPAVSTERCRLIDIAPDAAHAAALAVLASDAPTVVVLDTAQLIASAKR